MVLMLSGLVSGLVRTAPISVPIIFLGLGLLLGDGGLGLLQIGVHDEALGVVAILSLAFVLFLDAVNLRFDEGERAWLVPVLALGPGTLLTVGIVAAGARLIFGHVAGRVAAAGIDPGLDRSGGITRRRS